MVDYIHSAETLKVKALFNKAHFKTTRVAVYSCLQSVCEDNTRVLLDSLLLSRMLKL